MGCKLILQHPVGLCYCSVAFHAFFSASWQPCFLWGRKSTPLPVTVLFHVVTSSCFASASLFCWLREQRWYSLRWAQAEQRAVFWWSPATQSDLQWHNNVRLLLVFTTFIMITLITSKPNIVDRLHSDVVSFWGQSLLFFLTLCTFISIFWCNFAGGGNQTKSFCFWDEIMLLSYFYTKQDRTALNCLHSEFRSVNLWVL